MELYNLTATQPEKLHAMRTRLDALTKDAIPAGGATTPKRKRAKGKK